MVLVKVRETQAWLQQGPKNRQAGAAGRRDPVHNQTSSLFQSDFRLGDLSCAISLSSAFATSIERPKCSNELWRLNDDWVVELDDAVAVYRDRHGKLRYQQSVAPTAGQEAAWGGLWGSLLGRLLATPFTAGASAAAGVGAVAVGALVGGSVGVAGGALDETWWKEDFGISDDFVRDVSKMIGPGDSAVFAWLQSSDPEMVAERFRGFGGKVPARR